MLESSADHQPSHLPNTNWAAIHLLCTLFNRKKGRGGEYIDTFKTWNFPHIYNKNSHSVKPRLHLHRMASSLWELNGRSTVPGFLSTSAVLGAFIKTQYIIMTSNQIAPKFLPSAFTPSLIPNYITNFLLTIPIKMPHRHQN